MPKAKHSPRRQLTGPLTRAAAARKRAEKEPDPVHLSPRRTLPHDHKTFIFVWGAGYSGQIGLGEEKLFVETPAPLRKLSYKNICDIDVGYFHNVALTDKGTLWSWGENNYGSLGRVTKDSEWGEYVPQPVDGLDGVKIVRAVCGREFTFALSEEGRLYATGTFTSAEDNTKIFGLSCLKPNVCQFTFTLYKPTEKMRFISLAAGRNHMLALTADGRVYSWGDSAYSSLGRRISTRNPCACLVPERIAELSNIVIIGSGAHHCFAVRRDGKVFCWGLNDYGQCGVKSIGTCVEFPVQIEFAEGKRIREIKGGRYMSAFLLDDGKVYMFGRKEWLGIGCRGSDKIAIEHGDKQSNGQMTQPGSVTVQSSSIVPTSAPSSTPIISSTTHENTLSTPKHYTEFVATPTLVHTSASYCSIAVGYGHTLASTKCWNSHAWGRGDFYALANAPASRVPGADEHSPYTINDRNLTGFKVVAVGAGTQHSVALAWREQQYTLVS